ncbi:E3 ubiquitin/ISG15 ligase TRIM25-like [Rana temporaria]|uniref:E3 ubiquitin/ISG15 ligase TRIM25-like n=1 Tax=Rana temporaria TaxID=8407 RepID=UPI001AAC67DB|nr:E3 ubiquitin/ISG15 ligase TRIM25-like [Rana temporaria]
MASTGLSGELKCSICLSIYTNPVMLTCGHNFCENCIENALDRQRRSGIYTCPECRKQFTSHPVLQKNLKLSNIVEHYLSSCQSPHDEESFCTYGVASNHVCDPASSLKPHKCPDHNELLKYFCIQDSSPLCTRCTMNNKHKGHDLELLSEAGDKKRLRLCDFVKKLTTKTENTENIRCKVENYKRGMLDKADVMKDRVVDLFGGIREQLNTLENEVLAEINQQEKVISRQCSQEIQRIDAEISALYKRKIQIQQTCKIADHLTLLQQDDFDMDLRPIEVGVDNLDEEMITVIIMSALSRLMEGIPSVKNECGFHIEDSSDLILNVNTADPTIALSYDLKEASGPYYKHRVRPHLPERFYSQQVLSTKRIASGKHYWEIKASEDGDWSVGVTYNSVRKSGYCSQLGKNNKSWCISWSDLWDQLYAEHDDEQEDLFPNFTHELGIYLDYEGGIVAFYALSNPIEHLHTFYDSFTQPLHLGIYTDMGTAITICR